MRRVPLRERKEFKRTCSTCGATHYVKVRSPQVVSVRQYVIRRNHDA